MQKWKYREKKKKKQEKKRWRRWRRRKKKLKSGSEVYNKEVAQAPAAGRIPTMPRHSVTCGTSPIGCRIVTGHPQRRAVSATLPETK